MYRPVKLPVMERSPVMISVVFLFVGLKAAPGSPYTSQ